MPGTISEILTESARKHPQRVALVEGEHSLTYEELDALSSRFAASLRSLGLAPGDRVTLHAANSWKWVVTYFGVLKAGGVINPANVMLTPNEIEYIVTNCSARFLVTSEENAREAGPLREGTGIERIISLGRSAHAWVDEFSALLDRQGEGQIAPEANPQALSTIAYTSGTTGHPKGAMHSHRNVVFNTRMTAQMHLRTMDDVVVSALPCPHVYGNVVMNSTLLVGGTLVLHGAFDADTILASIERHQATMFEGVPTMYYHLLGSGAIGARNLSSLTRCTVGGQTMPVAKMKEVEQTFGCPLIELWGMTELAGLGSTHLVYGEIRHGSIGIPLPYTEMAIVAQTDPDRTLPDGEMGELVVAGPHTMLGYYGDPEPQAGKWLRTGDVAYRDADGYFYIVDRCKDVIVTAGYNVYPAEIERVLASHPAVAMVAVGSIPDDLKGERPRAYVVLKPGASSTETELIDFCRGELAPYKLPRAVQFVYDLPKTSTGKIMRRALRPLAG